MSTLRALARRAATTAETDGRAVLAVLDARRGEAFAAAWLPGDLVDPLATPVLAPAAVSPQALAAVPGSHPGGWLAVGEGAVEFRAVLEQSGALVPDDDSDLHRVSATDHCRLAMGLPSQSHGDVRPAYLRLPDAEISRRAARQS
jgi:tRNA threonylcarbamoyladenosine biosynthesis protein TsaB